MVLGIESTAGFIVKIEEEIQKFFVFYAPKTGLVACFSTTMLEVGGSNAPNLGDWYNLDIVKRPYNECKWLSTKVLKSYNECGWLSTKVRKLDGKPPLEIQRKPFENRDYTCQWMTEVSAVIGCLHKRFGIAYSPEVGRITIPGSLLAYVSPLAECKVQVRLNDVRSMVENWWEQWVMMRITESRPGGPGSSISEMHGVRVFQKAKILKLVSYTIGLMEISEGDKAGEIVQFSYSDFCMTNGDRSVFRSAAKIGSEWKVLAQQGLIWSNGTPKKAQWEAIGVFPMDKGVQTEAEQPHITSTAALNFNPVASGLESSSEVYSMSSERFSLSESPSPPIRPTTDVTLNLSRLGGIGSSLCTAEEKGDKKRVHGFASAEPVWEPNTFSLDTLTGNEMGTQTVETEEIRRRKTRDMDLMTKRSSFLEEENKNLRLKNQDFVVEKDQALTELKRLQEERQRAESNQKAQTVTSPGSTELNAAKRLALKYKNRAEELEGELQKLKQSNEISVDAAKQETENLRIILQAQKATNERLKMQVQVSAAESEKTENSKSDGAMQTEDLEERNLIEKIYRNDELFAQFCALCPELVKDFFKVLMRLRISVSK